jgi:hypothetical protein
MHPFFANPRALLTYTLACLLVGVVVATWRHHAGAEWGGALMLTVPVAVLYGYFLLSA